MSHYRRILAPGGCYFFTLVTHQRQAIFIHDDQINILRAAMRRVMAARPFEIDAMVVLPDHLHCIWQLPPGDADFASRWREIKKAVSREIAPDSNARQERPVWQRRFWEHLIRDDQDWRQHMDYIHYNPVKHGLVHHPSDWPWSSFKAAQHKGWYEADWGSKAPVSIAGMDCE